MPSLKDLSKKIRDYFNPEANQGDNFWGNDNPFIKGLVKTQQLPTSMREDVRTLLNKPITLSPANQKRAEFAANFATSFAKAMPGNINEQIQSKLRIPQYNVQTEVGKYGNITGEVASNIVQTAALGKVISPAFSGVQKPLGTLAGKIIPKSKFIGKGVANISQGLPYTTAFNVLNKIENPDFKTDVKGDVAFDFATGMLPFVGVGGMVVGKNAKNFKNLAKLEGGFDSQPKAWLSDYTSSVKKDFVGIINKLVKQKETPVLADVFNHKTLYQNYPQLQHIKIELDPNYTHSATYGSFDPLTNTMKMNPKMTKEGFRSTLVHEVQHAVQEIEGFAKGTNLSGGKGAYRNAAGEVEARTSEFNLNRRADETNLKSLYDDTLKREGIKREDVIVSGGGKSLSKELKVGDVNQAPRVTSKSQIQVGGQKTLKVAKQNLPTQPQGELPKQVLEAPTSQKSSVPDLPYGDSIARGGLKGTKTLFGNEPIKTDAVSSELDSVGKAKLAQRAKLDAERAAKDDYNRWYKSQRESGQIKTTGEQLDIIGKGIEGNTKGVGAKNIEELKDIGNIAKGFDTVKRNFKAVFDKRYGEVEKEVIEPFYRGKDLMTRELESWSKSLKSLGIQKGSKISAMVQLFGEKKVSYEGLINKFGKGTADKIVGADKFFRNAYNTLIDDVNKSRAKIYPNNPEKIIPKRADYYRHFKEMQEGVAGLKNIFESPSGVQSTLAGISADTKPKSKWLSFAQRRGGDKTTYDAVGGFIDYVQKAMYAKHIDPNIENFRNLSSELEQATLDGVNKGKLNNFIEYLNDFANDLSGKTGPIDRAFQKYIPGGRKAMRALNWLNNRIKANVILMNASSSVAQLFNIPQGIANAGPKNAIKGLGSTLADIFSNKTPINKSRFVRERYSDPFSGFNTGFIDNARDMAKWLVTIGDEIGTKFIWNSHYAKALAENAPNAIKYADDATESMVAGRGVGEVPILQKDKVFQLVAPFQLEVGNLWYVMKGWVDEKQFQKLATFAVASYFMNRAAKEIRGSDVSFDPINALVEGLQAYGAEEDKKIGALKLAGRQAGEVLSNVPGGQSVAALYPEYGATVGDTKLPTRKDLFGEGDPTRYGSGLLVAKGLQDPISKIVPPFGGQQIKRTTEGLIAVREGESKTKGGDTQYLIDKSLKNYAQAGVFGKYSVPEAQEYFKGNKRPLSEKQSEVVRGSSDKGSTYNEIMQKREDSAQETKLRESVRESGQAQKTSEKYTYLDKDSGEVRSINLNPDLNPPKLTGITELDKKAKSQYNGKITKRANDVYKLYELGQMTEEQAGKELAKLAKMKLVSGKKGVKISMGKVKRRISNIKINKARKIRSIKFRKPKSAVIKTRGVKKSLGFKVKKYAQPKPVKFINTLAGGLTKLV